MLYLEPNILLITFLAIFFGAIVKGTLGVGLPMIAVPIMAFFLPPTKAMILLCFPILFTNFFQMQVKKKIGSYRYLPLILSLIIGLIIGGKLILQIDKKTISQIIAISIILAAIINLFEIKFHQLNIKYEKSFTILLGFFSGILGGLSTLFGPPILAYLISARLEKEYFVRTVASIYFIGSIPLFGSLLYHGFGEIKDLYLSVILILPSLFGLYLGAKLRNKLPNKIFRKCILLMLLFIGTLLFFKNI